MYRNLLLILFAVCVANCFLDEISGLTLSPIRDEETYCPTPKPNISRQEFGCNHLDTIAIMLCFWIPASAIIFIVIRLCGRA